MTMNVVQLPNKLISFIHSLASCGTELNTAGNPMFFRGQRLERFNLSCQQRNPQLKVIVIVYQPRVVACQCRLERPRPPSRQAMCSDTYNIIKEFTPIAPY